MLTASLAQTGGEMWPRFVWELNLTTLLTFVCGAGAFYLGVMRQRDSLRDLKSTVEKQVISMAALKFEQDAFKDKVVDEYVRKRDFDPVVDKLFDKIDEQGAATIRAVNGIYERLLDDAKHDRLPPTRR